MNGDLERMLEGNAEMCALVDALRAAPQARVDDGFAARVLAGVRADRASPPRWAFLRRFDIAAAIPAAAVLALLLGAAAVFLQRPAQPAWSTARLVACQRADGTFTATSAAPYVQAFAVSALAREPSGHAAALDSAVGALVRDQNAEGGWSSASLSARNVAALREAVDAGVANAARAYRRGLRYLRLNGIVERTPSDLAREAKDAFARLSASTDLGLAYSAALCAGR